MAGVEVDYVDGWRYNSGIKVRMRRKKSHGREKESKTKN
ncbi:hypothetical protein CCACVL1_30693 [Corchorus capsularis]|uniref:Uncharacterized protein n=1 Tax=Corchorus capsularis TaxID=210143 RepID=A0A1R3FW08_COCAP|nr:hypothetical protein CCACVL1_30693 [Corchorus capsularis]